jgi:hypothetical protein
MDILSTKTQKAKKTHVCDYCWQKINAGQFYEYSAIVNCGDFYTFKNHVSCHQIALCLKMFEQDEVKYEGLTADYFQEWVREEYDAIMIKFISNIFNSKTFKYPSFDIQLNFVKKHHKII